MDLISLGITQVYGNKLDIIIINVSFHFPAYNLNHTPARGKCLEGRATALCPADCLGQLDCHPLVHSN